MSTVPTRSTIPVGSAGGKPKNVTQLCGEEVTLSLPMLTLETQISKLDETKLTSILAQSTGQNVADEQFTKLHAI